jgi:YebC/PmpR family DNA-binding regulatory protein
MAGHSKWANIKRQKARVDAVKGKVFTKISREIIVAARSGSDPAGNFQLRTAIDKAKAAGIPNDNIERAIAKGSGKLGAGASELESIRYEGYGVGGVAILIEGLTDNRNRTAADLRVAFSKNGGNLGETGCVSWMFEQKGVVTLAGPIDEEKLLEALVEGEAESYELTPVNDSDGAEVSTAITNLEHLAQVLKEQGFNVVEAEWRWIPNNIIEVDDAEKAKSLMKLMNALDDLDDVQSVTANFEMSDRCYQMLYNES